MIRDEVRKGLVQFEFNNAFVGIIPWEILGISAFLGIYFTSWWWFFGSVFVIGMGMATPVINYILIGIISIPFAMLAGLVGSLFGDTAMVFFMITGYLVSLVVHIASVTAFNDVS